MTHKCVFLDIDGTILRPDHTIADSTKEAVYQLQQKGIHVAIATGRPLNNSLSVMHELQITSHITFNGAHGVHQGAELFHRKMNEKTVDFLFANAVSMQHDLFLFRKDENIVINPTNEKYKQYAANLSMPFSEAYNREDVTDILSGVVLMDQELDIHHYHAEKALHFSRGNVQSVVAYDINDSTVNKGTAIAEYLRFLGIRPEDVVAFGDGMNDKEMLSFVGHGVAMGNAQTSLLPYANTQTTSVTEDGIWNGLKSIGLVK